MRLEQLNSLNDDELCLLWGCVNYAKPPVISGVELSPSCFVSIKHRKLMARLEGCRNLLKEEHKVILDGLIQKIKV